MSITLVNNKLKCIIANQISLQVKKETKHFSIWNEVARHVTAEYCRIDELKVKEVFFKEILPLLDQTNYGITDPKTVKAMKDLVKPKSKSSQDTKASFRCLKTGGSIKDRLRRSNLRVIKQLPAKHNTETIPEPSNQTLSESGKKLTLHITPSKRSRGLKRKRESFQKDSSPSINAMETSKKTKNEEAVLKLKEIFGQAKDNKVYDIADNSADTEEENEGPDKNTSAKNPPLDLPVATDYLPFVQNSVQTGVESDPFYPQEFFWEEVVTTEGEANLSDQAVNDGIVILSNLLSNADKNPNEIFLGESHEPVSPQSGFATATATAMQKYDSGNKQKEIQDSLANNWELGNKILSSTPNKASASKVLFNPKLKRFLYHDVDMDVETEDSEEKHEFNLVPKFVPNESSMADVINLPTSTTNNFQQGSDNNLHPLGLVNEKVTTVQSDNISAEKYLALVRATYPAFAIIDSDDEYQKVENRNVPTITQNDNKLSTQVQPKQQIIISVEEMKRRLLGI